MRNDPPVIALVTRAAGDGQQAWASGRAARLVTRRARIPRSGRRWGSRSGASARSAPDAYNGYGRHQLSRHSVRGTVSTPSWRNLPMTRERPG
jgi:hypothetical protein